MNPAGTVENVSWHLFFSGCESEIGDIIVMSESVQEHYYPTESFSILGPPNPSIDKLCGSNKSIDGL